MVGEYSLVCGKCKNICLYRNLVSAQRINTPIKTTGVAFGVFFTHQQMSVEFSIVFCVTHNSGGLGTL